MSGTELEELRIALDNLAESIAETKPISYILDSFPERLCNYVKSDTIKLLMVEFAIAWTFMVVMADVTLYMLEKI